MPSRVTLPRRPPRVRRPQRRVPLRGFVWVTDLDPADGSANVEPDAAVTFHLGAVLDIDVADVTVTVAGRSMTVGNGGLVYYGSGDIYGGAVVTQYRDLYFATMKRWWVGEGEVAVSITHQNAVLSASAFETVQPPRGAPADAYGVATGLWRPLTDAGAHGHVSHTRLWSAPNAYGMVENIVRWVRTDAYGLVAVVALDDFDGAVIVGAPYVDDFDGAAVIQGWKIDDFDGSVIAQGWIVNDFDGAVVATLEVIQDFDGGVVVALRQVNDFDAAVIARGRIKAGVIEVRVIDSDYIDMLTSFGFTIS